MNTFDGLVRVQNESSEILWWAYANVAEQLVELELARPLTQKKRCRTLLWIGPEIQRSAVTPDHKQPVQAATPAPQIPHRVISKPLRQMLERYRKLRQELQLPKALGQLPYLSVLIDCGASTVLHLVHDDQTEEFFCLA